MTRARPRAPRLLAAALGAALALAGAADARAERVVRVKDGDSLVVRSETGEVEVRLASIDAPEYDQPFGEAATRALRELVEGEEVRLVLEGADRYGRVIARVYVGDAWVGEALVRRGLAWIRREFAPDSPLIAVEEAARAAARGLWADDAAISPWAWRARHGTVYSRREKARAAPAPVPEVACGSKRYCRDMGSCDEAMAYLRECGLTRIDGDADGVPCEKLCRYRR